MTESPSVVLNLTLLCHFYDHKNLVKLHINSQRFDQIWSRFLQAVVILLPVFVFLLSPFALPLFHPNFPKQELCELSCAWGKGALD